jgi:hypothetical protein
MIHSGAQFAFVGLEILFLLAHSNVAFKSNSFSKTFLMHVLATNFWFWIVVGEAAERQQRLPLVCNNTITETRCINESALSIPEFNLIPENKTGFPHLS